MFERDYFTGPEEFAELSNSLLGSWQVEEDYVLEGVTFLHPFLGSLIILDPADRKRPPTNITLGHLHEDITHELAVYIIHESEKYMDYSGLVIGEEPRRVEDAINRYFVVRAEWPVPRKLVATLGEVSIKLVEYLNSQGIANN